MLYVRPSDLEFAPLGLRGTVLATHRRGDGSRTQIGLATSDLVLEVETRGTLSVSRADVVYVRVRGGRVFSHS